MKKLSHIKKLMLRAGSVINEYDRKDFVVSESIKAKGSELKTLLLREMQYNPSFSFEAGLFFKGIILAERQADGQDVLSEFKANCDAINQAVADRAR